MRRLKFIVDEIRRSTGNKNVTPKTDNDIVNYLNRAQSAVQKIVLKASPENSIFADEKEYTIASDQYGYDLPSDIVAQNSVIGMMIATSSSNPNWSVLRQVSVKDFRTSFGYYIIEKKFYLSPTPNGGSGILKLTYNRLLPKVSLRVGIVTASTSGVSVTINPVENALPFTANEDISLYEDGFCVVGSDGTINEQELDIDSFTVATGVILTSSTFTNVNVGDYVTLGKISTTHAQMPDSCENYLMTYVERLLLHHDSSTDTSVQDIFTNEEREDLISMFEDNNHDTYYPPITDTTLMGV